MKRLLYLCIILMLPGAGPAHATPDAQEIIRQTTSQVINALKLDKEELKKNPRLIYDVVNRHILPAFDFTSMSRLVLGKHWRTASNDEKARFIDEFRLLLVRTYASAMLGYSDQEIVFLSPDYNKDAKKVKVKTEIEQPGSTPIPVDYSLYLTESGEWKVYDVTIDNVSLVLNYRSTFSSEIEQVGSVGKLIEKLHARNTQVISE